MHVQFARSRRWPAATALTLAITLCTALLSAQGAWAETVPLPAGAATGSGENALIWGVACASAGNCVGGISYQESSGSNIFGDAFLDETNGTWTTTPASFAGFTGAGSDPQWGSPEVFACPSAGNCVMAGTWINFNGPAGFLPLGATETNGTWTQEQITLPNNLNFASNNNATISAISCGGPGQCVAVGAYKASVIGAGPVTSEYEGLLLTYSNGTWTASRAPLPTGGGADVSLDAISCPSAGNCVAVGTYTDTSGNRQGLILTESNSAWSASEVSLAGLSTAANPIGNLRSVSCPQAGNCTAAGTYVDGSSDQQGLLLTSSGGVWGPAVKLSEPANATTAAGSASDYVSSVSCATAGNCVAVGEYNEGPSGSVIDGFSVIEANGNWQQAQELPLPVPAASNPDFQADDIYCSADTTCVATGDYANSSGGAEDAFMETGVDSTSWSSSGVQVLPSITDNWSSYVALGCVPGYCVAGGNASKDQGEDFVPILEQPPGAPTGLTTEITGHFYLPETLTWTAPADNGGLPITAYNLNAVDQTHPTTPVQDLVSPTAPATFTGLTNGDDYYFLAQAQNALGTSSPDQSPTVTIAIPQSIINAGLLGLKLTGKAARISSILEHGGYRFGFDAIQPGTLTIRWYARLKSGKRSHRSPRLRLLAHGSADTNGSGTVNVKVKLNKYGRNLLRASKRLTLRQTVSFASSLTPDDDGSATATLHLR